MGNKKSKTRPYQSLFSETYITPAHFIAELVCSNIARKHNKKILGDPLKTVEWASILKRQRTLANGLIKIYNVDIIIQALHTSKGKFIFSLNSPLLDELVQKAEVRQQEVPTLPEIKPIESSGKKQYIKPNNKFSRLDDG